MIRKVWSMLAGYRTRKMFYIFCCNSANRVDADEASGLSAQFFQTASRASNRFYWHFSCAPKRNRELGECGVGARRTDLNWSTIKSDRSETAR